MILNPKKRSNRPIGAYSLGPAQHRASVQSRIESGVVLRKRDRAMDDVTAPIPAKVIDPASVAEAPITKRLSRPGPSSKPAAARISTPVAPAAPAPAQTEDSLKAAMTLAIAERRYTDALSEIIGLVALNPLDPRWPHKYGDILRTLGRTEEAAAAFRRSATRYEASGFSVRAKAMLRLADELEAAGDPELS